MNDISLLAQQAIRAFEQKLAIYGITPVIHFELEGGYQPKKVDGKVKHNLLNYSQINQQLNKLHIQGELKPEYWRNQWEYVSHFNGQSPLTEAKNLAKTMQVLPQLFKQQGIDEVLIKPVLWSGDQARLLTGCENIFSANSQAVHIPNAVQINVSANNEQGHNMVPEHDFGEILQQCLLTTSNSCCLIFLPEEEAFKRIQLKQHFQLDAELSSPDNISGGHQGSIALYKQFGKHNQPMGQTPVIYGLNENALVYSDNWQSTSRVEHRLGASSIHYCPFTNVAFALANLVDAVDIYQNLKLSAQQYQQAEFVPQNLPVSLYDTEPEQSGAITLFEQETWFAERINATVNILKDAAHSTSKKDKTAIIDEFPNDLGTQLKHAILAKYQQTPVFR